MISNDPFSNEDLTKLEQVADELDFEIVLSPQTSKDQKFLSLFQENKDEFIRSFPILIDAPTDDKPFFFYMLRLKDFARFFDSNKDIVALNMRALFILGAQTFSVILLSAFLIFRPLLKSKSFPIRQSWPYLNYFLCIGFGFMLIEISQMQRLNLFLGHPVYGLSVVLFSLLLSSSFGSYLVQKFSADKLLSHKLAASLTTIALFLVVGAVMPTIEPIFKSLPIALRIVIAFTLISPIGISMGAFFPLGMYLANRNFKDLTAWLWGVNGASSVCASVIAVLISLNFGVSATFWTGVMFYTISILQLFRLSKN